MKKTVLFIISFIFIYQGIVTGLLYINYQIDIEAITEQFCINKDKPELKCNGKCHLAKQIEKHESPQPEKSQTSQKIKETKIELFQSVRQLLQIEAEERISFYTPSSLGTENSVSNTHFHPPIIG